MGSNVQQLVDRARVGDKDAFADLVTTHQRIVYALAYQHAFDKQEAEDIAQEAFLRAYRDLRTLRKSDSFTQWLCRITLNVTREKNRARRPFVSLDSLPEMAAKSDPQEEAEIARLMVMVSDLPEEYRVPLTMRYIEGMSYRDIAEALHIEESSARSRVHRARAMLREQTDS